jgi:PAS domain S-box-containing protein
MGNALHGEETFKLLLDAAPDAVVVVGEHGLISLINLQTERLFGHSRAELVGKPIEILIPKRFHTAHVGHRTRFSAAPTVRPMGSGLELFGLKRDGTEFPIEISLSPIHTANGRLTSASIRDITDRKASERKVSRIQGHLLSAVESVQGGFAIFDSEDRLVLCNSTARALLGKDISGEIVGKAFTELLELNLAAGTFELGETSAAQLLAKLVAYHRAPVGPFDVRSSEGRNLRFVDRRTQEGGTVLTIWDVSDDVEHEEELRGARAAAEAASSAKSEFLASMSHELRTPLNAILGFAQLLQRDKKEPLSGRHRERIEHVLKGGEHLLRLIDDVLDLSRIEAGRVLVSPEPVDLSLVLSEVKATLDPMAARAEIGVRLRAVDPKLPAAMADRTRLKQILMNYGSNAIKYGRKNGTVTFETSTQGDAVRITVADDGLGIAQDKQEKIFQPFHRAGQETGSIEGTGIGLAITRRLAELMGGSTGFESTEGEGSKFWIELPLHRAGATVPQPKDSSLLGHGSLLGLAGPRLSIVYIEDNPSNIAFMEDLLSDFERVELATAPTAEIGVELVRARRPNVVIMDINLPGMSGFEATRRLREWPETREIPVIALSAAAMVRDEARVREAGFYKYLTKPVKVDELAGVLEELLGR